MRKLARRCVGAALSAPFFILAAPAQAATGAEPAGGAAIGEVMLATGGAAVLSAALLGAGMAYRNGRLGFLQNVATWSERRSGLPAWAAVPGVIAALSLVTALLGMYWDISLHIDEGRDAGPLANPAHYLILAGLGGIALAGFLAMVLPRERIGGSAVRITDSWDAPLGGVLLFAAASFSLLGFPLDDMWHRIFGQDVTLWGPTHLMLIGGAALTLIGRSVLLVEGARTMRRRGAKPSHGGTSLVRIQRAFLAGGFLIGLSTFQAEFDFGVPQFQFLFQPGLIMLAASIALVTARIWAGRGGALLAVAFFVAVRGAVSLAVGPVFGETVPHFPIYVVEAIIVELLALRGRGLFAERRPLAFGATAGALIGTVGLAAEWAWSHVWMPLPWPAELLPEAALLAAMVAVAGGAIGALIGATLASDRVARPRGAGAGLALAGVAVVAFLGYGLQTTTNPGQTARVALTDVGAAPERTVSARVVLEPRDAARDARWLTVTAWQGGGFVLDRLERVDDGVYRTTKPIPVHGDWKTLLRLHHPGSLQAVPMYLPRDEAIPAPGVPATRSFERQFVPDKRILQREAKDAPPILTMLAYALVLGFALGLIALMVWGLRRLALDGGAEWRRAGRTEGAPTELGPAPSPVR